MAGLFVRSRFIQVSNMHERGQPGLHPTDLLAAALSTMTIISFHPLSVKPYTHNQQTLEGDWKGRESGRHLN